MSQKIVTCPDCGGHRAAKNGKAKAPSGKIQCYRCKDCGRCFTEVSLVPKPAIRMVWVESKFDNQETVKCPRCGSQKIWKAGCKYPPFEEEIKIQCYLCKDCERHFSQRHPNHP